MSQTQLAEFKEQIHKSATSTHTVDRHTRGLLSYVFAGTRGGITRLRIIMLLLEDSYNTHQIAHHMALDYKAIQHHLKVLEKNSLVSTTGKKYGALYNISNLLEHNIHALDAVTDKLYRKLNSKKVYI